MEKDEFNPGDNVFYIDESRKSKLLRKIEEAKRIGGVATFNLEYDELANVIQFPKQPDTPDGIA